VNTQVNGEWREQTFSLPDEFDFNSFHLLRIELNAGVVRFSVDGGTLRWNGLTEPQSCYLALLTHDTSAMFAGFAITVGWEDLFTEQRLNLAELGWNTIDTGRWFLREGELCCEEG
jgi:hypothetical protein